MNRIIIVTGTPSTGKTTLARNIAKTCHYTYLDVNEFIEKRGLREGYDMKNKCYIVDEKKLSRELEKIIKFFRKNKARLIIDSHLSHYINPKYIDLCIVAKCDRKILYNRYKRKGYSKKKIQGNMECEIMDICLEEARDKGYGRKIKIVDCSKKIAKRDIKKIIK